MRSILKKIAERKNYKDNISIEAEVDPRNLRTAAQMLTNSTIIHYAIISQNRIQTTFRRLSAYRNWVAKENAAIEWSVALGRGANTHCMGRFLCIAGSTHSHTPPTGEVSRRRAELCNTPNDRIVGRSIHTLIILYTCMEAIWQNVHI